MATLFRFEYGQTVRIVASAPVVLRPGTIVAVVGMTKLQTCRDNDLLKSLPKGTTIYLIEYADGSSVEVPEQYIESVQVT